MKKYINTSTAIKNSSGMASILVTIILMLVVTLIILGFSQISSKTQRESLDNQLSNQAYYAADSGVNDVANLIKQKPGTYDIKKTDCQDPQPSNVWTGKINYQLDPDPANAAKNVIITCLLVDPTTTTAVYNAVQQGVPTVIPIKAIPPSGSPNEPIKINLTWKPYGDTTNPWVCPTTTSGVLSPSSSWNCPYAVLRADIVYAKAHNTLDDLSNNNETIFAVPTKGGVPTIDYNAGTPKTVTAAAGCNNTECSIYIGDIAHSQLIASNHYYLRVSMIYGPTPKLEACALDATSGPDCDTGTGLPLKGTEAVVDSTGEAYNIVRRVRAYIDVSDKNSQFPNRPANAIQSEDSICKQFLIRPGIQPSPATPCP